MCGINHQCTIYYGIIVLSKFFPGGILARKIAIKAVQSTISAHPDQTLPVLNDTVHCRGIHSQSVVNRPELVIL
jgi:hypothetical protein